MHLNAIEALACFRMGEGRMPRVRACVRERACSYVKGHTWLCGRVFSVFVSSTGTSSYCTFY